MTCDRRKGLRRRTTEDVRIITRFDGVLRYCALFTNLCVVRSAVAMVASAVRTCARNRSSMLTSAKTDPSAPARRGVKAAASVSSFAVPLPVAAAASRSLLTVRLNLRDS